MAEKRFAFVKDDVIQAILRGFWHFADLPQATRQLGIIKERYFVSRHAEHPDTPEACTLWIKGYEVTEEQAKQGGTGNFARIECMARKAGTKGKYTLAASKVEVPVAAHPQKRRRETRQPNWGHPILRAVDKKRVYPTQDEALQELILLQQEYPHAAVPGENCLHLQIFGRVENKKERRVKLYTLTILPQEKGGYIIEAKRKEPRPKKKPLPGMVKKPEKQMGFFTSKVVQKRKRKKP